MLITLADCLKEHIQSGVNEKVVREQLSLYSELSTLARATRPASPSALQAALATAGCDVGRPRSSRSTPLLSS